MHLEQKICVTCNIIKNFEEFYFRKQTGKLQGDCKACYQAKKRKRRKERIECGELKYIPKKKKCIDCDNLCDARKRIKRCYSCENKKRWRNEEKRQKQVEQNKKMWKNLKFSKKMSERMKKQRKDKTFNEKLCNSFSRSGRLSRLHKRIRQELELDKLGFVSEKLIGVYFVDELNEVTKTIIEINGDYIHANPKLYKEDSIIRIPNSAYTAAEKWKSDSIKINALTELGYKVIVIWESDDLSEAKKLLLGGKYG